MLDHAHTVAWIIHSEHIGNVQIAFSRLLYHFCRRRAVWPSTKLVPYYVGKPPAVSSKDSPQLGVAHDALAYATLRFEAWTLLEPLLFETWLRDRS